MADNIMEPLPRIEDHVRRPTFIPVGPLKRFKQSDQVFARAFRGEMGEEMKKVNASSPPPHPMDRTVFGPTVIRSLLWQADEPKPFKWKVSVTDKKKMSAHIKEVAREFGADLVGITYLHPAFVFEDDRAGNPIDLNYKYAISMAKEMKYDRIATSPSWYDHFEVGKTYQDAAILATHLANYISQLGYPAKANTAGNESVFHVPLAVYAGLGESSRMGRLITKKYGPRVRLVTVLTDLPLETDYPVDLNIENFCQICEKCAKCCPAQSIPYGNEKVAVRGIIKWNENSDACYRFWRKKPYEWQACTRCIAVCPWNKRDHLLHAFVSTLAVKFSWMHRIILFWDDIFYGKKPTKLDQPPFYNEYRMKEEDYWQMLDDPDVNISLMSKKDTLPFNFSD